MPTEPDWSKKISNNTVCTWFYIFACMNALVGITLFIILVLTAKKTSFSQLAIMTLSLSASFINAWFLFLQCNRGLPEGFAASKDAKSGYESAVTKY